MASESERGKYTSPEGSSLVEYLSTFACFMLLLGVGCVAGFNSPALSVLSNPDSPISVTGSDAATLATVVGIGQMLAPTLTIFLGDKFGRKAGLLAIGIPIIISWGCVAGARSILVLCIGRFLGGLSIGLGLTVTPVYLGEIASAKWRGALGILIGMAINGGILFAYIAIPYLKISASAYVMLSIAVPSALSVLFVPESPYFLAMKGNVEGAEEALEKLRGKTDVAEELEIVKETVKKQRETLKKIGTNSADGTTESGPTKFDNFKDIFRVTANRRAYFINSLLLVGLHAGGYTSLVVYGSVIFNAMKIGIEEHFITILIGVLQLVFNILATFVIDRHGRRPLILVSGMIGGLCTLVISVYFYLMEYMNLDVSGYSNIMLFVIFLYVSAFNIGLMPIQLVIISETLASEIKILACLILGITGGVLATFCLLTYMITAVTWNWGHCVPFFGFTISVWASTALILKYLPETKGKTFNEIQRDLSA